MFVNRTHGVVATTLGVLALGACASPTQNTDLRPEGPPDVLAVLVMTDAASQLAEHATFCKPNDPKRPSLVGLPDATTSQICPDGGGDATKVTNAYPDGWYVRVMFDELLDPSVEELVTIDEDTSSGTIANTHPVELQCKSLAGGAFVDVPYDGYYSPAGNAVTWPLGPSLVIKPTAPTRVATGTECQITLNDSILDKQGNPVPAEQRGPFPFKIAEITPLATDPTDSGDTAKPVAVDALAPFSDNFYFQFNTDVQLSSFCTLVGGFYCAKGTENFSISPALVSADAGGDWDVCSDLSGNCNVDADCGTPGVTCMSAYAYTYAGTAADNEVGIGYNTPLKTETTYTFGLKAGAKLKDRCGAETTLPAPTAENLYSITFKTNKFDFANVSIASGETAAPVKKPNIRFNNVIDPTSLAQGTEFTISPTPAGATLGQFTGAELIVGGNFALDTQYTLTIKAGATVQDVYGATYTNAADKVITWKTAPKVLLTSATADLAVLQKITTVQLIGPSLTWNANMDLSTLATTEWSLVNAATMAPVVLTPGYGSSAASANCTATSQSCQFRFRSDFAPGDYIFTLKAGATVSDLIGNVYTQAADRVIHFTVKAPPPAVQCL